MTIPTEPIGSIPRPDELMTAGRELTAGRMPAGEYDSIADTATRDTTEQLEAAGSPVITDGELAARQLGL